MRRAVITAVVISLVAGLLAPTIAVAGKSKKARKAELTYTEPAHGAAGFGVCLQGSSCINFPVLPGEKKVDIKIEDDLGLPVHASVIQDTSGDGSWLAADDYTVHICGQTEEPIELKPGLEVTVWVWRGPGLLPPCPGMASAGTVTGTFTK